MFARIAGRYDLLNRLLSARRDVVWRRIGLDLLEGQPGTLIDLACGTFDVGLEALARGKARRVHGLDFCLPMLQAGDAKRQGRPVSATTGDALRLPLTGRCCDTVSISYGWRNVADPRQALSEMRRILQPGGEVLILEFFRPMTWWTRAFYGGFARWFFPLVGGVIGGDRSAYRYLHDSVRRFLSIDEAVAMLTQEGFTDLKVRSFAGGVSHAIRARLGPGCA